MCECGPSDLQILEDLLHPTCGGLARTEGKCMSISHAFAICNAHVNRCDPILPCTYQSGDGALRRWLRRRGGSQTSPRFKTYSTTTLDSVWNWQFSSSMSSTVPKTSLNTSCNLLVRCSLLIYDAACSVVGALTGPCVFSGCDLFAINPHN